MESPEPFESSTIETDIVKEEPCLAEPSIEQLEEDFRAEYMINYLGNSEDDSDEEKVVMMDHSEELGNEDASNSSSTTSALRPRGDGFCGHSSTKIKLKDNSGKGINRSGRATTIQKSKMIEILKSNPAIGSEIFGPETSLTNWNTWKRVSDEMNACKKTKKKTEQTKRSEVERKKIYDTPNKKSMESLYTSPDLRNKYYSTETDASNLKNILASWNLSDLFEFFQKQQLYVDVLKHLTEEMAKQILQNSNFSLGIQAEFYYNWSQWIKTEKAQIVDKSNKPLQTEFSSNLQSKAVMVDTQDITLSGVRGVKTSEFINLHEILANGPYGPGVLSHYKMHNALNDKTRKLLVDAFLHYCASTGCTVSKASCKSLSNQIQETFQGEIAEYYYVHRAHGAPLGKLYNKYHNWKNSIRSATDKISETKAKKLKKFIHEVTESEQNHMKALKLENLDFDEKLMHWKGCVSARLKSFDREYSNDSHRITELWPQYKEPSGYKLIECDFDFAFGVKQDFLDKICDFVESMISRVFPQTLKGNENLELLNNLIEKKEELHPNGLCAAVFHLLQTLIPNRRQKILSDSSRKNKHKTFSTKESQQSFIAICETEAIYKEYYDSKIKNGSSAPPCISIIGTLLNPKAIFCDFENIMYKFHSLPKAIDICFKTYHLFRLEYSPAAKFIWQFINLKFYNLKDDHIHPAVHCLLKTIRGNMVKYISR